MTAILSSSEIYVVRVSEKSPLPHVYGFRTVLWLLLNCQTASRNSDHINDIDNDNNSKNYVDNDYKDGSNQPWQLW